MRTVRAAWETAKSRLRPKPKPEPSVVASVPSGDLYDPWIDG